jgi:hypothetical protein
MVPAARSAEPQRPPAELPPPTVEPPRSGAPPPSGEPRAAPQAVEATEPQYVPTTGRHGAVLVPQIGVSSFLEEEARYLGPGLRVGGLAGAHLTNEVSLGGALAFDLLNWDPPPGGSASGFMLEAAFTPLFHAGDQRAEFVVGPAIGAWMASSTFKDDVFGDSGSATAQGWALGGNMGLFAPVSKSVRVGALINFMVRDTLHACATLNAQSNCAESGPAHQVIGFTAAAML